MSERIVDYKVVTSFRWETPTKSFDNKEEALAMNVKDALAEGWELLSGVSATDSHGSHTLYQAMIRRDSD